MPLQPLANDNEAKAAGRAAAAATETDAKRGTQMPAHNPTENPVCSTQNNHRVVYYNPRRVYGKLRRAEVVTAFRGLFCAYTQRRTLDEGSHTERAERTYLTTQGVNVQQNCDTN